ncbi:ABC transporter permease [Roseisalinus antarcticus]|uniref:Putative D,D-dipeptide transport system permease protein DdpC n=1 Tax=Roseisalinus antarcticus TaxID=254357 RepID=A0A1Y5TV82_9RHOB|nr:ABC transporter permease [Roseisalinus antarcticus]SLN73564.1 putative D,D-dipeptide transport system permease protein DdpC [Roseisalinus antarcticus]
MAAPNSPPQTVAAARTRRRPFLESLAHLRRDPTTVVSAAILVLFILIAIFAPLIAGDPTALNPIRRLGPPAPDAWLGTDQLGRDVYARAVYGTRVSLIVGGAVAVLAAIPGVAIGIYASMNRVGGAIVMRLVDALMAIPAVLLAIALAALLKPGLPTLIIAISIPEIPRMVRLVRSVALSVTAQPYVTAAIAAGSSRSRLVFRHILPNTLAPVIVQATYAAASAIIASAILSFLGVGTSPEVPSWGGMMADARGFFRFNPELMFYPGLLLSVLLLVTNILGDRLSDALDPRKVTQKMP